MSYRDSNVPTRIFYPAAGSEILSLARTKSKEKFQKIVTTLLTKCVDKDASRQLHVCQWRRSGVVIVNFEHISHLVLVFLLLTLRR